MWRSRPVSSHRMVRPRAVSSTAILILHAISRSPFAYPICVPGFGPADANVDLHECQLTFGQREPLLSVPPASSGICTPREEGRTKNGRVRLVRTKFGLGFHARFSLFLADLAVLEVAAFDGALRGLVPLRQTVAERIAEARRLRPQLRQAELLPDLHGALHVFALGQRERRHVALH